MADGPRIEKTMHIDAPPEVVFSFFTSAGRMALWCGEAVEMDARPGGRIRIRFEGGIVSEGWFEVVDPPDRVVFTVGMSGTAVPVGGSRVVVRLTPEGGGTRLELRHEGFDPSQPVSEGWDHHLGRLAAAVAGKALGPDRFAADTR